MHGVAVKTIRRWRRLYQRRGLPRGGAYESPCPRCDGADLDLAAYAHLLGWYLGDGHIAAGRRGVFVLSISNDPKYPDLNEQIAESMRLVKPTASPCMRSGRAIRVESRWKHWPCLFPQHGPGRKHERSIVFEDWQRDIVAEHPGPL